MISFVLQHPDMHQMDNLCQPHLCEQANVDWSEQIRINEPWSLPAITRQPADLAVLTKDTNIHVGPQRKLTLK